MSAQTTEQTNVVHLTIDGKAVVVPKGTTIYHAAKDSGIDIPIFCYHDRMPPFGACRMCLVEVEKMPKLQIACSVVVTDGMVVKTQSSMALEGRKETIEFLLINHPLDCPICDRGGECPLQDNALKHGPGESRFYEEKRRFKKAYPLGPVLMLDRERCIVCARCTRFGDVISGDHALEFIDRGYKTEVGTPGGGPAESKFIGNTIMICPVGALTSQVYRFRARPWDNQPANSTCTLCPVGCSLIFDSRDGEIMRTRSCTNRDVNDIWLCDKGWFGYEFTANSDRLQTPLVRRNGQLEETSWDEALSITAEKFKEAKNVGKIAAFGGNPLTFEENYLFQKFMREVLGIHHVDHRIGMSLTSVEEEGLMPGMEISIGECEELSFAVLLGIDITEEFPVIWLRLRQAINRGAKMIFLGHFSPEISHYLSKTLLHTPGQELDFLRKEIPAISALAASGKKGALFVGKQYLNAPWRKNILHELVNLRNTLPNLSLNVMEGRGNSLGARLAGMRPDLGPFGERIGSCGLNALQVLENAADSGWDVLHVAGADPAVKYPSKLWNKARSKLGFLIVQDLFFTETAKQADVVLPTLSFVEKEGSFINIERRVQKLSPGKQIPENRYSDAEIFVLLAKHLNVPLSLDLNIAEKLDTQLRQRSEIPNGAFDSLPTLEARDGQLLATFAHALFDQGVRMKHNPHLIKMAREPKVKINPLDGKKLDVKDGSTVRLYANGNSIIAKIKWDKRVAFGAIVLPLGFEQIPVRELSENLVNGLAVEIRNEVYP